MDRHLNTVESWDIVEAGIRALYSPEELKKIEGYSLRHGCDCGFTLKILDKTRPSATQSRVFKSEEMPIENKPRAIGEIVEELKEVIIKENVNANKT